MTKANGTVDLDQKRVHTKANEVESITTTTGTAWWTPTSPNKYYDAAGNFVAIPQAKTAATMADKHDLTYDAWNRLVQILNAGSPVGTYQYDGAHRRVAATTGGSTRDVYFTKDWQAVEERVGGTLERQNVWGLRYADDLVLRDRDTDGDGTLDERRYALHDYFHVTAITNSAGAVQERYGYDGFGAARVMTAAYSSSSTSSQTTDVGFGAYHWDKESGLYLARHRYLHPRLGRWITRDPIGYRGGISLYRYARNRPVSEMDPKGLLSITFDPACPIDFIEHWRKALIELLKTPTGVELLRGNPRKLIKIFPYRSAASGPLDPDAPLGEIGLNPEDPLGLDIIQREWATLWDELPPDTSAGAAVVIGHEIGHVSLGYDDPENAVLVEELVRQDLGIPPRGAYYGEPFPGFYRTEK